MASQSTTPGRRATLQYPNYQCAAVTSPSKGGETYNNKLNLSTKNCMPLLIFYVNTFMKIISLTAIPFRGSDSYRNGGRKTGAFWEKE